MDPDACLDEIRSILAENDSADLWQSADRLAELVDALDDWITKGGWLPDDWRRAKS